MTNHRINYAVVGIFVIAALVSLVAAVAVLTGQTGSTTTYFTTYKNVGGLKFGTQVLYEGYPVGQVEEIAPEEFKGSTRFRITLAIAEGWRIPADSIAEVSASGLLAAVTIKPWFVQMLEVALSRRMCCSRVCSAMRKACLPRRSIDTPMMRPGK